jgi:hypothetical protein
MKTILSCLLMLSMTSLGSFACSGDSGPGCTTVCEKMVTCAIESSQAECESECNEIKPVMRSSVWSALGDCFMDNSCEVLSQSGDYCFGIAMSAIPAGAGAGVISDMCDRMVTCDDTGTLTKESCLADMQGAGDDSMEMLGMFTDSTLNCVGNCIGGVDCAEVQDAFSICSPQCGLTIFEDDG